MTEHESTPEQWTADRYDWARADTEAMDGDPAFRCIMELCSRVEALEAAAKPAESNYLQKPDSSLVERVADAIYTTCTGDGFREEARAAIREVAAWLRQREARVRASVEIAGDLEREINQ